MRKRINLPDYYPNNINYNLLPPLPPSFPGFRFECENVDEVKGFYCSQSFISSPFYVSNVAPAQADDNSWVAVADHRSCWSFFLNVYDPDCEWEGDWLPLRLVHRCNERELVNKMMDMGVLTRNREEFLSIILLHQCSEIIKEQQAGTGKGDD